jgi:hypothetical protein
MFHEELKFKPVVGSFDVPSIRRHLDSLTFVVRDSFRKNVDYLIGASKSDLKHNLALMATHGEYSWTVCAIIVQPDVVILFHQSAEGVLERAQEIAQWLIDNFDCRIYDDWDKDITDYVGGDAAKLYPTGPE